MRFLRGSDLAVTQARICANAYLRRCGFAASQRKRAAPVFVTGWKPRESLSAPVAETIPMAPAVQKITLSSSRDIPFNKLVLSQSNVRRAKAGVSIEELAEDIARRTLLQSLNVRPGLDAEDGMWLDQLMACTVTSDHARQEQVWETLQRSYSQEPYQIRRMLTERTVRTSDKRALFVGLDAYEQAGGIVMRDLFQQDDGGWLENGGLLDGLVAGKLEAQAEKLSTADWKRIE